MKSYSIQDIESTLRGECQVHQYGEKSTFTNVKSLDLSDDDSLVWISPTKQEKVVLAKNARASIILCDETLLQGAAELKGKCLIVVKDPRLAFLRIVESLFSPKPQWGIHPSAIIHEEASIHPESYIGPQCYIGKAIIGKGSILKGACFVYDGVSIGEHVMIHAGTVIGADGFGYQRNDQNEFEKFPHIGGVRIEDHVDIGANTCIDRGTLGDTIIKEGAKIDNLVHIAHNVVVGKHAAVIAHAMVGGSTIIDDYAWIAPNVSLREGIKVGANSVVGLGAVVTKSIPENETWTGNPAKELSLFIKQMNKLKDL